VFVEVESNDQGKSDPHITDGDAAGGDVIFKVTIALMNNLKDCSWADRQWTSKAGVTHEHKNKTLLLLPS
jgi:hypothetical protein